MGRSSPPFGPIFVRPYTTSPDCAVSPLPPMRSAVSKRSSLSFTTSASSGRNEGAFRRRPVPTSNVLSCTGIDLGAAGAFLSFSSSPDPVMPVKYSRVGASSSSPPAFTPTTTLFLVFFVNPKPITLPSPPPLMVEVGIPRLVDYPRMPSLTSWGCQP